MNHKLFLSLIITSFLLISCNKDDNDQTPPVQTAQEDSIVTGNNSTLVSGLNGFQFEASFTNTEPVAFPYLDIAYIDDYQDSVRIVTVNQDEFASITEYLTSNHYGGVYTRGFNHAGFPNNQYGNMKYSFHHSQFLLNWWVPATGEITTVGNVFGMNTSVSKTFTGGASQYSYEFMDQFLIRYISGVSLWPFHHQNWSDSPQFVVTQESSEPKAWDHWYDESFSTFPYDVKSNMYTGFLNVRNDTAYVGIAKGDVNLDTIYFRQATWSQFNGIDSKGFLDKSGDTLWFGLINNIPGSLSQEVSVYQFLVSAGQLLPLYLKQPLTVQYNNIKFYKGKFYAVEPAGGYKRIDRNGTITQMPVPATSHALTYKFSRNKFYAIVRQLTPPKIEVYSIDI